MIPSSIATLAQNIKKPTKAGAFDIIRHAITADGTLTEEQQALLYAYFLPPVPKIPKTEEQWVAQALADKKDLRFYLPHLYSDGIRLIATDGGRLHWCIANLPAGFYNSQLESVICDAKYPDIDRVIPKDGTLWQVTDPPPVTEVAPKIRVYTLPCGLRVRTCFWDAATVGMDRIEYLRSKSDSVRISREYGSGAVIVGRQL